MNQNRAWVKLGDGASIEEVRLKKDRYLSRWRDTPNFLRLKEKKSFKVIQDGKTIEEDF